MSNIPSEATHKFNADFVKIFTGGVSVGIVLLGYSYTHAFFRNFGLSLFQLKMEWIDILFRGIALLQDWRVSLTFALLIIMGSIVFSLRSAMSPARQVAIIAFIILGFLMGVTFGGESLGYLHARAIWEGGAGKPAFCRLKSNDTEVNPLAAKIDELSRTQRIRLVHQTKDQTFLAPVLTSVRPNQLTGEAYVIPTSSILFCRVVGS